MAKALSVKKGITVSEAINLIDEVTSIIRMGVITEGNVNINGFGRFSSKRMKQKRCIHPTTKEEVIVPEYTKVVFKPTNSFLD